MGAGLHNVSCAAGGLVPALANSVSFRRHFRLTGRMRRLLALAVLSFSTVSAVDVANMGGTWILNVQRSKWHSFPPPDSGRLVIEHQEPKLKYERHFVNANVEDKTMTFEGAIDGKDYGGVIAKRLSPFSILFTRKTEDGTIEEVTVTITKDGGHLVRRSQSNGPGGKLVWTELYDKEPH